MPVLWLIAAPLAPAAVLELDTGSGRLGALSWEQLDFDYRPGAGDAAALEIRLSGLALAGVIPPGDVILRCPTLVREAAGMGCNDGRLDFSHDWLALEGAVELVIEPRPGQAYQLRLEHPQLAARLEWSPGAGLAMALERLDLALLEPMATSLLELGALGGLATGRLQLHEQGLELQLDVEGGFFDTRGGQAAGDGLVFELVLDQRAGDEAISLDLTQRAGELLLGPVYLPPPEAALSLQTRLNLGSSDQIEIEQLRLSDPGTLRLAGGLGLISSAEGWQLGHLQVDELWADMATLWPRWLDGPAAAFGFSDMDAAGTLQGSLGWRSGGPMALDLRGEGVSLRDPRQRSAIGGLDAWVSQNGAATAIDLAWQKLDLLGLSLGGSRASLHYDEVGLRLLDPVRMPLLDGAVVIDGLAVLQAPELASQLILDARIEPVDLARLTRVLDLPELGGRLAGRFPGVTYRDQRLAFTGGIEIEAFSGQISIQELVIERLFGSTPALAAQVELERLDLLELTGAFGFGRMQGQASGRIHDLRLLNWRPVAMDARLYTHDDAPTRRISQRAVDNLASLGGGGSALVSGTVLRLFEDFPYRRAGLACRLANNICRIAGVAAHESGGFLIVEGRGLPRLDIVGHRRLVDWPQLMSQLADMIERGSADPGQGHGGPAP
ncbi:MAG: hypothetical protein ACLFQC_05800 [Wenzhouxiangella sp.]